MSELNPGENSWKEKLLQYLLSMDKREKNGLRADNIHGIALCVCAAFRNLIPLIYDGPVP